jgi:hypothetical protein
MAAYYTFEDLSGAAANNNSTTKSDNPYQDVIDACSNDAVRIPIQKTSLSLSPCPFTSLSSHNPPY